MNQRPLRRLVFALFVAVTAAAPLGPACAQAETPQNSPADPPGDTGSDEAPALAVRRVSPQQRLQGADIRVHGAAQTEEESPIRLHGGGSGDPSAIQVHDADSVDPARIRVRRFGGRDTAKIKVHGLGKARPSRIRVHR